MSEQIQNVLDGISNAGPVKQAGPPNYHLDALTALVCKSRVTSIENDTKTELKALKERQAQIKFLHQFLKAINASTDSKGGVNLNSDPKLPEMIAKAQELGVEIDPNKTSYTKEEKDRLVDNFRMTIEDLNIQNDMQQQTIARLTNERYEMFQLARSIMKPLHDDKLNKARAIGGR